MPSDTYGTVRNAIKKKLQIVATYGGHVRQMCPHVIGLNKNGGEQALFFQFAGGSSSGLPPEGEWRCIDLSKLTNVSSRDGKWHTGTGHSEPQKCVKDIDVEVPY